MFVIRSIILFVPILIWIQNIQSYIFSMHPLIEKSFAKRKFCRFAIYDPPSGHSRPAWFRESLEGISVVGSVPQNASNVKELAIFPFDDGNCLPTGNMPLHIFVMKYRRMMNDLHDKDLDKGLFGLVMSTSKGGLCEVGCAVQNIYRKFLDDGRQFCLNESRERFRILQVLQDEPYIIARVEYGIIDTDINNEADRLSDEILYLEKEVWQALQDVVNLNNQILATVGDTIELSVQVQELSPLNRSDRLRSVTAFSFAVADMLDLTGLERQLLLDCTSAADRLRTVRKYLYTLREELMLKVATELDEAFN